MKGNVGAYRLTQSVNINLEVCADHAVSPCELRPDSRSNGGIKALFKFSAKLGGSAGIGLEFFGIALIEVGSYFYVGVDNALFDIVAEHFPIFFKIIKHGCQQSDDN